MMTKHQIHILECQLAITFPETKDRYIDVVYRNQTGYYIAMRHESRPGIYELYLELDHESLAVLSERKVPFHVNDFPILEYRSEPWD